MLEVQKEGQCNWSIVISVKEAGIRGGWRDKKVMVRLLLINKCQGYSYIFVTSDKFFSGTREYILCV